jgi:hypothetical protein
MSGSSPGQARVAQPPVQVVEVDLRHVDGERSDGGGVDHCSTVPGIAATSWPL